MARKIDSIDPKIISSAAGKLLARNGASALTIPDLANEMGVSEASVRIQVKNQKEVLGFLIDDLGDSLTGEVERASAGNSNAVQVLERIALARSAGTSEARALPFLVLSSTSALGDRELNQKLEGVINDYLRRIQTVLTDGIKSGIVRPDTDAAAAARLFFGMLLGSIGVWALSRYESDLGRDLKSTWQIFLKSIFNTSYDQTA